MLYVNLSRQERESRLCINCGGSHAYPECEQKFKPRAAEGHAKYLGKRLFDAGQLTAEALEQKVRETGRCSPEALQVLNYEDIVKFFTDKADAAKARSGGRPLGGGTGAAGGNGARKVAGAGLKGLAPPPKPTNRVNPNATDAAGRPAGTYSKAQQVKRRTKFRMRFADADVQDQSCPQTLIQAFRLEEQVAPSGVSSWVGVVDEDQKGSAEAHGGTVISRITEEISEDEELLTES